MSKKTKKSRVNSVALGSLAGIATIASVASVIACGNRSKENAPSNQQVDTSHINLDSVKVFDNGEVRGLPQLPKGVHLDYFLDGQTKVVHNVRDLGQLQAGVRLYLQLGADAGYALNGDLHKTSVLIDHHASATPTEQEQVRRTIVQVSPEAIKPITVRQGDNPVLPTILGGTWVLEGASGTFVSANYQPGDVVRFNLKAASEEYKLLEPVQLSVAVHGVITDATYNAFATAEVHVLPGGHTAGLPSVPTNAHWHYSAQVPGKEITLDKDGSFPADTALTVGDVITITVVADANYEFSGAIPEGRDFTVEAPALIAPAEPVQQEQVRRTIVQVSPEDIAPITVRQGDDPALPIIPGGTWVFDGEGTFVSADHKPGDAVTFTLQAASEEYVVPEPVQLSVTVHGVITDATYNAFATAEVHVLPDGHTAGLPSVPTNAHWHYSAQVVGREIVLDSDGIFPDGTTLTIGSTVTITVVADANYEFSGAIPAGRDFTVEAPALIAPAEPVQQEQVRRTVVQVNPEAIAPITVRQGDNPALPIIPGGTWVFDGEGTFVSADHKPGDAVTFTLQAASEEYVVPEPVQLSVAVHGVITDATYNTFAAGRVHILSNGQTTGLPSVPIGAHWHYAALVTDKEIVLNNDGSFPADTALVVGDFVAIAVVADQNYEFSRAIPVVSGFTVEAPALIAPESVQQEQVRRTVVQVNREAIKPITVRQGDDRVLPIIPGGKWVLENGGVFKSADCQPGATVILFLQAVSEEYVVPEPPVQLSVTVHGVTGDSYKNPFPTTPRVLNNGVTLGIPPVPSGEHWHYSVQVAGKEVTLDENMFFPTALTVGDEVTITVVPDANYELPDSASGRGWTIPFTVEQYDLAAAEAQMKNAHVYSDGTTTGLTLPKGTTYYFGFEIASGWGGRLVYIRQEGIFSRDLIEGKTEVTIHVLVQKDGDFVLASADGQPSIKLTIEHRQ